MMPIRVHVWVCTRRHTSTTVHTTLAHPGASQEMRRAGTYKVQPKPWNLQRLLHGVVACHTITHLKYPIQWIVVH